MYLKNTIKHQKDLNKVTRAEEVKRNKVEQENETARYTAASKAARLTAENQAMAAAAAQQAYYGKTGFRNVNYKGVEGSRYLTKEDVAAGAAQLARGVAEYNKSKDSEPGDE